MVLTKEDIGVDALHVQSDDMHVTCFFTLVNGGNINSLDLVSDYAKQCRGGLAGIGFSVSDILEDGSIAVRGSISFKRGREERIKNKVKNLMLPIRDELSRDLAQSFQSSS